METKQTGRVIFIFALLAVAIFFICPQPQKLFSRIPLTQKLNLKPGIDMVGGTSLLYEIKEPDGGYHGQAGHTLAEDVMESLKKRVDPDGLRNLIWRPQGANRLEIQLPSSADTEDAAKIRDTYAAAQRKLEDTNIRTGEVNAAVEQLKGEARTKRLNELAMGIPSRVELFGLLAKTYDQMRAAHAKQDADLEAQKIDEYDKLKLRIEQTNLSVPEIEAILQLEPDKRAAKLDALRKASSDYPVRVAAINDFVPIFDQYSKVKGSIDDAAQLKQLLRGSGVLEFHIVAQRGNDLPASQYQVMVQRLHEKGPRVEAGDQVRWFQVDRTENFGFPNEIWNDKHFVLCWITPDKSMINGPGFDRWSLEAAFPTQDPDGGRAVGFRFDTVGAKYFGDFTGSNMHRPLAAVLDNKVVSAANINARITREGIIENGSGYDDTELTYLVSTLNAGSLPAQLEDEPISERTVGPQLGEDNLRAGLLACLFGLVIVAVFLISYYYLAGVVATFAVLMNVILILGILAAFNATFTLPGIAGIVLTIGAAVDANVLIFERLREEQHLGLSLRMAMRNAYKHATSAILDSNATTVITSIILVWLGSEEVKGFGLTLLIGLCSSLFTALFVTRTIFNIMIDKFRVNDLSSLPLTFPKWDKLLKPDIDWMKLVPYFVSFSGIFILAGVWALVVKARAHELADIDFASGTQVQFELKQPMPIGDLRALFTKADNNDVPAPSIVSVNKDQTEYEVVTPNVDVMAVRNAVLKVVGDRIKTDLPSQYDHYKDPAEAVIDKAILPITKVPLLINGYTVPGAENYMGGAAIVLNNLNPPMKLDEIKSRLDRARVQPQPGEENRYHQFTVVSPNPEKEATDTAIVLTSDPDLPYDKDQAKWRESLATPMWKLIGESINKQAQLQKVNNFDAQVAGDTQQAAIMSLVLSSLVIMAYIWFRFGNLKYGTATVLAMIHDTALVAGAVGISHWIVQYTPELGKILMVEPFRVNLTLVAAILTVMSYSMIDTIVVFDRIRENRGKFGHMSRKIVNDSINQTLSRTLLTAGTNIVTVAGMYFVGGPGIHGFTFVLLIGILVGTYSSIAIAAPILLMGSDVKTGGGSKSSGKRLESVPG